MVKRPPPKTLGNRVAPRRFILFLLILLAATGCTIAAHLEWRHGVMIGFDIAALVFLASCLPFLRTSGAAPMRDQADRNDPDRMLMLAITGLVMLVVLVTVGAELTEGTGPRWLRTIFIIATLALTWLFSNAVFALHYAHLYYRKDGGREGDRGGLKFEETREPDYLDFLYFAFTLGMTFQTSDVTIASRGFRRVVTFHCLAAFVYNLGVLAFTISVLSAASGGH